MQIGCLFFLCSDLIKISESLGLSSRPLKVETTALRHLKSLAALHWDLNYFVVLRAVNRKGISILDSAIGKRFCNPPEK